MVDPFSPAFTIDSEHSPSHVISDGEEFIPHETSEQDAQKPEAAACCEGEGACLISWKPLKASVA